MSGPGGPLAVSELLQGEAAPPRSNGELVFEAPWQGRVLALALGVVEHYGLEWDAFRQRLVTAVAEDPDRPYYDSFTAALESLVADLGVGPGGRPAP